MQIPISFKVGQALTTTNVSKIFLVVFGFSFVMSIVGIIYWLRCAGAGELWKPMRKFGIGKSAFVFVRALLVDGLLVASLWRTNKKRWFMHGMILYGFLGLMLADILMSIFNPARGDLPLSNPLKLLPIVAGASVLIGIVYVMRRYKTDPYIDNGLTLGRDFLFVNLLFHTTLSGFLTVAINRMGAYDWVMTIYIYHLMSILLLIATAPFTRFQHAWIVPLMIGFTRLTEAIVASGVDIGFRREPSPGRHHKSHRIALSVLESIGEDTSQPVRMRYYP